MFGEKEIKNHLIGLWELFLFMPTAIERFDGTPRAALRSFVWTLLSIPLMIVLALYESQEFSPLLLSSLHLVRVVIAMAMSLFFVYYMAKVLECQKEFWRFVTIQNWFSLTVIIMLCPVLFALYQGGVYDDYLNYLYFLTVYTVVVTGFIITHTMRINWYLASFIAVSSLFFGQTMWDLSEKVRDMIV